MALDNQVVKNLIDSNLPDSPPGQPRKITPAIIRYALKAVLDWVRDAVANNVSTWIRTSDNLPGGSNTDDIYRTGVTRLKGGIEAYTRTPDNKVLAQVGNDLAAMRVSSVNGGPAYIELHHPGVRIDKIGTDQDGVLKFGPWFSPTAHPIVISGLTPVIILPTILGNRKIVLYDGGSEHQFYGFGINGDVLRYQVLGASANHIFYAGLSPATSAELMRIAGNGNVSIGDSTSNFRLKVVDNNPVNGWVAVVSNSRQGTGRTGAKLLFDQNNLASWAIGQPAGDVDAFVIEGSASTERLRIDANGLCGIGTKTPTSNLHLKGNGSTLFRLENQYTPTSPGDPNGAIGQFCWDDNYIYVKTTVGWRRTALSASW